MPIYTQPRVMDHMTLMMKLIRLASTRKGLLLPKRGYAEQEWEILMMVERRREVLVLLELQVSGTT